MNYDDEKPSHKPPQSPSAFVLPHAHSYTVAPGPVTVRYCEDCGVSWVLDGSYGWHWVPVDEPTTED